MALTIYWTLFEDDLDNDSVEEVLSQEELEKYHQFKFPRRRDDWLRGRLAARYLLQHSRFVYANLPSQAISVCNEAEGAPYFAVDKLGRLPGCLSISHSHQSALCGLVIEPGVQIGLDLEFVEPRNPELAQDFFTPTEKTALQAFPAHLQDQCITLIWSAKEAMLKALGKGLRLDTRQVEILLPDPDRLDLTPADWQPLQVRCHAADTGNWQVQWQAVGTFILTAAVYFPQTRQDFSLLRV